jgi:hypothetical protein
MLKLDLDLEIMEITVLALHLYFFLQETKYSNLLIGTSGPKILSRFRQSSTDHFEMFVLKLSVSLKLK